MSVDEDKVKAMRNAARPLNILQLRSFLVLVNYYRFFTKPPNSLWSLE